MSNATQSFATPEAILSHGRFSLARAAYIDAVMELYEAKPPLLELMRDGGRIFLYGIIMALWGAYREDLPSTWPTVRRLKETVGQFGVASPRQIDLIVARFAQVGQLKVAPAPNDLRMRIVLPTPALIEHDRSFIQAHYRPHGALFGADAYALPLRGDLAFHKATRAAWVTTLGAMARETILKNRPILRFYAASAGMLMLMKLVRLQEQAADGQVAIDFTDFGRRFAVSRTHVRMLFQAVAADGDMEMDARGRVRVGSGLVAALDRNIAERMSLLDRSHAAALARLAAA